MVFVIHWHESAMDIHVFPILIPPPTSLSTWSLWVFKGLLKGLISAELMLVLWKQSVMCLELAQSTDSRWPILLPFNGNDQLMRYWLFPWNLSLGFDNVASTITRRPMSIPTHGLHVPSKTRQNAGCRCLVLWAGANHTGCLLLCVHAKLLQSCLTLCNPMDHSLPGSSSLGLTKENIKSILRKGNRYSKGTLGEGSPGCIEWIEGVTGEGNGNPLQCSCLENPRDGGAWWTAI